VSHRLQFFNTRTQTKEAFAPLEEGHARVYTCGPTVYSPQHIGNMRPNVFSDLLNRALRAEGFRITHVMNITDVGHLTDDDNDAGDDKIEKAARETGRSASEVAAEYTGQWLRDRERLNCTPPDVLCKATDHIPEQIAMIETLEQKGAVYVIEDGVYFDVSTFERYAELARLDLNQQQSGARVAEVAGKRGPGDFALWKFADPEVKRQQEWDSPWGRGFPGWHIECSAMSVKYLGERFDIHTGGVEHLPVHHTNELAQSETALGCHPWVETWMHHDWIVFDGGDKISKSKGHALVLQDLVDAGHSALAFRYFLLQAHYRKQQHWSMDALAAAETGYKRLLGQTLPLREVAGTADASRMEAWQKRFWDAVRDDLNSPRALAVATEAARASDLEPADRRALIEEFDQWLGLDLLTAVADETPRPADPRIDGLVAEREAARLAKDFATSDRIRDELAAEGIQIEDTPEGPRWSRVSD
jgi:cysteinyl-tRNA synthetase